MYRCSLFDANYILIIFIVIYSNALKLNQKQNFCAKYSECRINARRQFTACVNDNFVSMILTKNGVVELFNRENVTKFIFEDNKCLKTLDEIAGQPLRRLYEHVENKTYQCANNLSNSVEFHLDETQMLLCRTISSEIINISAEDVAEIDNLDNNEQNMQIKYGAESETDCHHLYNAEISRCELLAACCPQHARCSKKIDTVSGVHQRETILMRSFNDCIQKNFLKSQNVTFMLGNNFTENEIPINYTSIREKLSRKEIASIPRIEEMTAEIMKNLSKVEISLRDINPQIRANVYERLIRFRAKKLADKEIRFHPKTQTEKNITIPSTLTSTITPIFPTFPPPEKALKDLADFLFPGLRITTSAAATVTSTITSSSPPTATETKKPNVTETKESEIKIRVENAKSKQNKTIGVISKEKVSINDDDEDTSILEANALDQRRHLVNVQTREMTKNRSAENVDKNEIKETNKNEQRITTSQEANNEKKVKKKEKKSKKDKEKNSENQKEIKWSASEEDFEKKEKGEELVQTVLNEKIREDNNQKKLKNNKENILPSPWSVQAIPTLNVDVAEKTKLPIQVNDALLSSESEQKKYSMLPAEHIFCSQYFECREVLHEQYNLCEEQHLEENKKYGIADRQLRAIFEENTNVNDDKIQIKCYEAIDSGSQSQLIALREKIKNEIRNCTQNTHILSVENNKEFTDEKFKSCESIKLLSALSTAIKLNDYNTSLTKSKESFLKCNERLIKLEQKCSQLRDCCPTNIKCEQLNTSENAQKYTEIISQLKQEQNLCEKRHLRIRNGLM